MSFLEIIFDSPVFCVLQVWSGAFLTRWGYRLWKHRNDELDEEWDCGISNQFAAICYFVFGIFLIIYGFVSTLSLY